HPPPPHKAEKGTQWMFNQRNPSPTPKGRLNGVVHHALAFNTLLSSQETDAYTITLTGQIGRPELRGVPFRISTLQACQDCVKLLAIGYLSQNL
ncbi:hypothetical protein ACSDR0_23520, partial [Streptosporangium sp. G11]|uniref:hypothetical protein n=1 Tax=Streptosporangium sp. G11 TaxID=3436926 RepID=UPI003EBAC93D